MINYETNTLAHHGVLGMKWGVRRYQRKDGTLTKEGQAKYRQKLAKKKTKYTNDMKYRLNNYKRDKNDNDEKFADLKAHGTESREWQKRSYNKTINKAVSREKSGGAPLNLNDVNSYNNMLNDTYSMSNYMDKVKTNSGYKKKQIDRCNKSLQKINNYKIGELKTKDDYKRQKKILKKMYNDSYYYNYEW